MKKLTKNELRKIFLEKRKSLNLEVISGQIINKIRNLAEYKNSKNVMIFYPLKYEINLLGLLNDDKKFYLPKIDGENLLICPFKENQELETSSFKTKEPKTNPVNISKIDLIFVPALCVDKNNYRLGYGKGYYDRLLKNFNGVTVTPISEEFVIDEIPIDEFDEPVNLIVTENC